MVAALSLLCLLAAGAPGAPARPADALHRYWPRFPRPTTVLTVPGVPSEDHAFLLQSVSGLAARDALRGGSRELVWYPIDHPAYVAWRRAMLAHTGARLVQRPDIWDLVERLRERGVVRGYVVFARDRSPRAFHADGPYQPSANVATVLCARLGGVLVSEALEPEARRRGLTRLADARGITEQECFDRYAGGTSRRVLAMIDPKVPHSRAEAIALDAFVLATPGPLYERALARLQPDSPILGWGLGDEFRQTEASTRWGHFQTATNWCINLAALSTEEVGRSFPAEAARPRRPLRLWDLRWEEGVHYASFVMSDGDNVQWLMGDFAFAAERSWWNSPSRGRFAMGWPICYADLAQLCPYALEHLYRTAAPGDDIILLGGGYHYPDLFGAARPQAGALRLHARRMRTYMRQGAIRVLHYNASKWDSAAAVRAYTTFAEEIPELAGILMIQYAPYSAGHGRVLWVHRRAGEPVPVISARYAIWNHSPFANDGPPTRVAGWISALPRCGARATADDFTWVTVHAWSYFRQQPEGAPAGAEEVDQARAGEPGVYRGLEPVRWCVEALAPHVRVVTPTELVMQMRLRLRPQQTLAAALAELERSLPRKALGAARANLVRARRLLARGDFRACFETARHIDAGLQRGKDPR